MPSGSLSVFLLSVPVLVIGAALAVGLRSNRASAAISLATQAGAIVLVLTGIGPALFEGRALELVWPWPPPITTIAFRVDALGAFFLAWSLPMTFLGTVYAVGYLRPYFMHGRHGGPHFALLNLVALSFVLIYSVQNALVFLLGWEIAAVAAWLLVIWDYQSQKIRFAGFNYLVSTHVGLFVLVAAFMLLHSKTASMDFGAFGSFLARPGPARGTIFLLLGVSFALKSAFFPFHTWLPRAHAAAPAHVSALMSGVIHKAGLFGFLRFTLLMGRPEEWMGWTVLAFGALSAFFGVLYTSSQRDLKRLLGYSSTENVGIAAMGFGLGYLGWCWGATTLAVIGFAGGLLHVLNHAIFKCLLFYSAGAVYRAAHTVDLERLGGLARRLPRTAALFLIGSLAGSALPPFNGIVSEFLIYSGLLSGQAPSPEANVVLVLAAAGLAFVGAVSALSTTRAFGVVFLGSPRDATIQVGDEPPRSMLVPMLCHAGLAIALGVAPQLAFDLLASSLALFPFSAPASVNAALAPVRSLVWGSRILGILLLAVGFVRWRQGLAARRSPTWGCGYSAASPRMQYTGSSFVEHLARIFESFMPVLRRERIPSEIFPQTAGHLSTHHADAVERRIFEVLARGEEAITRVSERIPAHPGFAFAAGLCALLIIGALASGGWP
ncbi:MAG: proton-conducting transporter membrane subunit [Deltaproteobacteria bacterium]